MAAKDAGAKAAAAKAEQNGDNRHLDWEGLSFTLPPEIPGETLWEWASTEDPGQSIGPVMRLLREILGDEQDQQVRDLVSEKKWNLAETTERILHTDTGLFAQVLAVYGSEPGESSASPSS